MPASNAVESEGPVGMGLSAPLTSNTQRGQRHWLLRYILIIATLAFIGRAAPLSFLPLVLQRDFKQSAKVTGVIMAIYPCAALLATPWASQLARSTKRIVTLHSIAILAIAAAMALTSLAPYMGLMCGLEAAVWWIAFCRIVQGMGACLYLSSNTSLITRKFPEKLPYVIALTETAVGCGGQVGRMVGGFLFDLGGFKCPYIAIATLQGLLAVAGFGFEESSDAPSAASHALVRQISPDLPDSFVRQHSKLKLRWRELATPRLCVGGVAAFMYYFLACMFDATGVQYLFEHLAPVSISTLSLLLSLRGFTYMTSSFIIAQLMHHELVSFERLILCGATISFLGQILLAPQPFVTDLSTFLESDTEPSRESLWILVILATIMVQLGGALMFVPSLPLMQSEVRRHGDIAMEKAAEGLVTMMTLGEMLGPVWGGWIVGQLGYVHGTLVSALVIIPLWLTTISVYDSAVVKERRRQREIALVHSEDRREEKRKRSKELVPGPEDNSIICCECAPQCAPAECGPQGSIGDGDVSFALRRAPFAYQIQDDAELEYESEADL